MPSTRWWGAKHAEEFLKLRAERVLKLFTMSSDSDAADELADLRAELSGCHAESVRDLLGLVLERPPTLKEVASRSLGDLLEARDWAERESLAAADNHVRRTAMPAWLAKTQPATAKVRPLRRVG